MSDYEPPAEMVAEMERELRNNALTYPSIAAYILRRQHERESRLLAGIVRAQEWLSVGSMDTAQHELSETRAWYNKLDAPKVPTLLEAAKAMLDAGAHAYALTSARDALKAAVEREEKR